MKNKKIRMVTVDPQELSLREAYFGRNFENQGILTLIVKITGELEKILVPACSFCGAPVAPDTHQCVWCCDGKTSYYIGGQNTGELFFIEHGKEVIESQEAWGNHSLPLLDLSSPERGATGFVVIPRLALKIYNSSVSIEEL